MPATTSAFSEAELAYLRVYDADPLSKDHAPRQWETPRGARECPPAQNVPVSYPRNVEISPSQAPRSERRARDSRS